MDTLLKIAWRNLWRNKRRTLITAASVFTAVFLALLMRSMQIGQYDMMINAGVLDVGHIQIHDEGYWESQSINHSFEFTPEVEQIIVNQKGVKTVMPRLESFALASYGEMTKGLLIQGIDPELEDPRRKISNKLIEGRFIHRNDDGIVLAEGLSQYLKIGLNDTIVLIGQGYQGITAAATFPVVGIVKFPAPKMNNLYVFMGIENAQEMFSPYIPNLVTSIIIDINDDKDLDKVKAGLEQNLGENYEVMGWNEILTEMVQQIQSDNAGGIIMLAILYLIVAFGILGTVMMMTMERRKEFAIMVSVGMRRGKLAIVVIFETIFIGTIGVIAGIIAGIPILNYLFYHPIPLTGDTAEMMLEYNLDPIMPFATDSFIYTNQGVTILILAFIAALYPLIFVLRFKILRAMRS